MSELLTPEREILDVTFSTFLNTGSCLPLAEISVAGSPVAPAPLDGAIELPAPR
jgi:hypothetical protein